MQEKNGPEMDCDRPYRNPGLEGMHLDSRGGEAYHTGFERIPYCQTN